MLAGMDVARLNFSHGVREEHGQRIISIRQLNKKYRRHIRILQDLEGYRIRIGRFKNRRVIPLNKKETIILTNEDLIGENNIIPFDYKGDLKDIKAGSRIFIDDGNIELLVRKATKRTLKTEVAIAGVLKENKGINIPEVNLKFKGLTPKDRRDIEFGIKIQVDYIAQSFVRDKFDISPIRDLIKHRLPECKIIAKIENRQGIKNIDEIIDVSDGIMIARGDMGVSIPIYEIPIVQKEIIRKCNRAKRFVITATQMLESMVENLRPTRAEVTDVANAILDGSDYVMLSEETAAGKHPVEAVKMMDQIIKFTENSSLYRNRMLKGEAANA
jgi:pyruvate kinase